MTELSRLRWQCRRGTRELDIVLENYLDQHFVNANNQEQQCFVELLALEDSQLMPYLMGERIPDSEQLVSLIRKIRDPVIPG